MANTEPRPPTGRPRPRAHPAALTGAALLVLGLLRQEAGMSTERKAGQKCCPLHWGAFNRAQRRQADLQCPCRGECGCRDKGVVK
jgi:hypothetical protein